MLRLYPLFIRWVRSKYWKFGCTLHNLKFLAGIVFDITDSVGADRRAEQSSKWNDICNDHPVARRRITQYYTYTGWGL